MANGDQTPARRVTQKEIARAAGVSQTTVSLVLNGRKDGTGRVPEETRRRVEQALEDAQYQPDPVARRLAGLDNRVLGIFTYETALSPESMDFYGPLLTGIEQGAEQLGCDLIYFTGSPVTDGKRKLIDRRTRLRLADGCVILGQEMNEEEVARLVQEGFPCVAVGRREHPSIPYVGIDYGSVTRALLQRAADLGHRRGIYLHSGLDTPAARDRISALVADDSAIRVRRERATGDDIGAAAIEAVNDGATFVIGENVFVTEAAAHALEAAGRRSGVSFAALGEVGDHALDGSQLTGFHLPRVQMALEALTILQSIITSSPEPSDLRRLLPAELELGATLVQNTAGTTA